MLDFHREPARLEVWVLKNVLRRVDYSPLEAQRLRPLEQRVGVRLQSQLAQRIRHPSLLLTRVPVSAPHCLTTRIGQELAQVFYQPFLLQPRQQVYPLLLRSRPDAHVHVTPVPAQHLAVGGRHDRRVPARLTLHGVTGHQPVDARALSGHVRRRVHVGVYVLPDARELAVDQCGHHSHDREVTDYVVRLVAPSTHRRDRVVVVAAAPHRPTERQRG